MNKVREIISGAVLATSTLSIGMAVESNTVEAAPIQQGIYEIPTYCPDYVGDSVSKTIEKSLIGVGFTAITADGVVTSKKEQGAVLGAQYYMRDKGVIPTGVELCGMAGRVTESGVNQMKNLSNFAGASQINQPQLTTNNNASVSDESCDSIRLSSSVLNKIPGSDGDNLLDNGIEASAIQNALKEKGVYIGKVDGIIGSRTLGSFAIFQNDKFGNVDCVLGSQTFNALGIGTNTHINAVSSDIEINKVVVDKSDNTLTAYDGSEMVSQVRISHGDDRTYTYTKNGRNYTGTATTRTGTSRVYRSEGEDYASATLGGPVGSMGYAQFFDGGLAVHVGNTYSPSHGCIRVDLSNMVPLIEQGFGNGDIVVVQE